MARRKAGENKVEVGNIRQVSGKVTIAGGDIYEGYTVEQVSLLLKEITTSYRRKPFDGRCPYKGLDFFEEEDADLFFGRERLVEDLLGRVKESRTIFITGPSGSGKSSLVRAGLIHALKQGAIKSSERWLYETMKPGREPIKDLALAFSRLKSPELEDYFLTHSTETNILNKCAESVLSSHKDQRFVLFIDQFEEVFTQVNGEEDRIAFINMLAHAGTVENGRVIVLFAMRSDFVSNCATYPALNELLSQEFRQIGAMQPEELVSAIALPAMHVGLPIEDELIAQIINDMKGEPGALPLMQFALKDLFDSQQEKGGVIALTLKDYLQHGGIHKSLERHADATFAKLGESEQVLTRSIFSGLIEIGRGRQDTKRTALFDELIPANAKAEEVVGIVQKLADARLIITDEQAGKDTVTISHEKLIEAWPWLKKLVNENRDVIALQNEIAADAKEWEDHRRDPSYLYTGARLANAREQLEAKKLVLGGTAHEFVIAGQKQQRRSQTTRIVGVAIPIGLVIVGVIIFSYIFTTNSANIAKRNEDFAKTQVAAASTSQAIAEMAQANAEEAQKQTNIALARQLAAQAQSINATRNSKQMIAVLLSTHSMNIYPSTEASQVLLGNNFTARSIAHMSHDAAVYSVDFSLDGKYVVSGGDDNTVRVWEVSTGTEIARMTHKDVVEPMAFSPDGKYVVSGSWDNTARVWEVSTGREVARMTHDGLVASVAFSPDGKYVVSGSHDRTTRVWEASTGKEIARITQGSVISVAFSPDGKYVVSGDADETSTARVWEAATGKEIARMVHDFWVESVAFSPDGRYVVSGPPGSVTVWEISTGRKIASMTNDDLTLEGGGGAAPSDRRLVTFSPDGKYIVLAGERTARVWEVTTGKELARMTHDASVLSVAFSPDGKYVVSGSADATARVWKASTGEEIARMTHDRGVSWVDFSPDGKYVVSGSYDGTVRVWEALTGNEIVRRISDVFGLSLDGKYMVSGRGQKLLRIWEVSTRKEVARMTHNGPVSWVNFSPDGKYVFAVYDDYSIDGDYIVGVWEVSTGREILPITRDHTVIQIDFSSDGKYVLSESKDKTFRVWEAKTSMEVSDMTLDGDVFVAVFTPDGKYVLTGACETVDEICRKSIIRVWDTVSGKEVTHMTQDVALETPVRPPFSFLDFSPDGRYVAFGACDDIGCKNSTIHEWEVSTGKEVAHIIHNVRVDFFAFSPDGKYLVSGTLEGPTRVWEAATGKEIARMTEGATDVAFSPDGKYVLSTLQGNNTRLWEANTGQTVFLLDTFVNSLDFGLVAFSRDGKYVSLGGADGTARVWDISTGKEIAHMTHDGSVRSVAFSPDGKYVISGSADHTARVWEAMTGKEIARMVHFDEVSSVAFSPEGKYAISLSGLGTAQIWLWQPDDLITAACEDLPRNLTRAEWKQYIGDALEYEAVCPNLPVEPETTPTSSPTR